MLDELSDHGVGYDSGCQGTRKYQYGGSGVVGFSNSNCNSGCGDTHTTLNSHWYKESKLYSSWNTNTVRSGGGYNCAAPLVEEAEVGAATGTGTKTNANTNANTKPPGYYDGFGYCFSDFKRLSSFD